MSHARKTSSSRGAPSGPSSRREVPSAEEGACATRIRRGRSNASRSTKSCLRIPSRPKRAPYKALKRRRFAASSTSPSRLALITAVGPPLWATSAAPALLEANRNQ